jgi:ABC-type sugar transport system substrate-binding protein
MKKILALVLALALVFALAACSNGGTTTTTNSGSTATDSGTTAPATTSGKAYPNANADGSINLDTIAHFDNDYDYTQNPKLKVAYLAQAGGPLYQQSADAYEHWAPLYNMEWAGYISADGDSEKFMTSLQTLIDQGVTCFILDPDSTIFTSVVSLMENSGVECHWMSQMSAPRDNTTGDGIPMGGNMIHPYVGFDNYDAGVQVANKLVEWKNETYPDVSWDEVGCIAMAWSTSPPLQDRVDATRDVFVAAAGSDANFFVADCVSNGMNLQGGIDAVSPIISTHTEIKYWLVNGLIDDFAQAAATVIEQQGLTETSCVADFGGSALQMQWDAGQQNAYRYALFTAQNLYAEPILGAVYAFANGWATPDTIWPSWINHHDCGADGHTYPQLRLPTVWLEPDTYQHYLEWTDMYAHASAYNYSQDGIGLDDYSPFVTEVPAEYK